MVAHAQLFQNMKEVCYLQSSEKYAEGLKKTKCDWKKGLFRKSRK